MKIKQGRFKGYVGIVTSATPDVARVEIHSKNKTISIERNKVFVVGDVNGETRTTSSPSQSRLVMGSIPAMSSSRNEALGTPMHAPGTPGGYSDSSGAWDPKAALPTAIPTPAASGLTTMEPPTPAMFHSSSSFTPKTPATPATPAALGTSKVSDDSKAFSEGDAIKVISGEFNGKKGKVQGIDQAEAIVVLDIDGDSVLKILPLQDIAKE